MGGNSGKGAPTDEGDGWGWKESRRGVGYTREPAFVSSANTSLTFSPNTATKSSEALPICTSRRGPEGRASEGE